MVDSHGVAGWPENRNGVPALSLGRLELSRVLAVVGSSTRHQAPSNIDSHSGRLSVLSVFFSPGDRRCLPASEQASYLTKTTIDRVAGDFRRVGKECSL